jgi:hypothetical protein
MVTATADAPVGTPDPVVTAFGKILACAPAPLRLRLVAVAKEGQEAARRGELARDPVDPDGDVPANELVLRDQHRARQAALRSCLPADRAENAGRGLACLDADQHPAELAAWLTDPDTLTLILAGTTGSGKTMAAYATAAEAVAVGAAMRDRTGKVTVRPLLVRAWTVNGYLAELRPDGSPDPVWLIRDRARTAELLILDDLGAETDDATKEFVRKELVELIDYRVNARLRTIVTTNLRSPMVAELFGSRLMSRLVDRAGVLRLVGADRRRIRNLEW